MTLDKLFLDRVAQSPSQVALWIKRDGKFVSLTWNEIAADVRAVAALLRELGVQPGDRVIQVSENRYEWILVDLGILLAGAVHVPVHASLTGPQIAYQIRDSGARAVFVSTREQAAKLVEPLPGLCEEMPLICYDDDWRGGIVRSERSYVPPIRQAPQPGASGRKPDVSAPVVSAPDASVIGPHDLATILYTSGTTGEPKGVMLSHRNLVSNALASLEAFEVRHDDLRLTWLPLSHIFARTCDLYGWIAAGHQLALAESRETILADCAAVKPTFMNGVPYFFDKVQRLLIEKGAADLPGKLAELFGGRLRCLCSGGAALPNHTAEFYQQRGVLLVQGYGLTESSPVISLNCPAFHKLGTVGRAIRDVELRIAGDGEVLCRGPNVMLGYWQKPRETAAALVDGWLHTGDLGSIDAAGFLSITGRKKELIVTAAGKNIAPVYLEALLTEDPLIAQALVIGDGRNFLTALIVPNQQALEAELAARHTPLSAMNDWRSDQRVRALYEQRINQRLADVSPSEQVRKFVLLTNPFAPDTGELTPTLKLRRGIICAHYAAAIETMYQ